MMAITLERIDPAQNISRFYKIDMPTLFGEWAMIKEWGRIGRGGTLRSVNYQTVTDAEAACEKQWQKKISRGYRPV